jgi:hypothetical protein
MKLLIKKATGVLAGTAVLIFAAGCSSLPSYRFYDGPERPNNKLTRLAVPSEIRIVHIDGMPVKDAYIADAGRGARELVFMPGIHYLDVHMVLPWKTDKGTTEVVRSSLILLEFNGKPGIRYSLMRSPARTLEEARKLARDPGFKIQASAWIGE